MKRLLITGSMIVVCLIFTFPSLVSAQIIGGDAERTFLALELSGFYSMNDNVLSEVNDGIQSHYDDLANPTPPLPPIPMGAISLFEEENNIEYRLGFRLGNFHIGGIFTELKDYSAGFESDSYYYTREYDLTVKTREFAAYIGYMQPIFSWLEIGAYYTYGNGDVKGSFVNEFDSLNPALQSKHKIKGEYNPSSIEGRVRMNVTRYISLDFAAGKKTAETDMVVVKSALDTEYAISDVDLNPLTFDWTGTYYTAGITLVNPYGK